MKIVIKTPEEKKIEKLQKKYSGAKVINSGHFGDIKNKEERIKKKVEKITELRNQNKLGGEQLIRYNEVESRFTESVGKIDDRLKEVSEEVAFWWSKRVELLEESLDLQLIILEEKIIK